MNLFFISTLEQGFIFALVALGVFITYKILDFPDLSVDGTFPLGGAVVAFSLSKGINPFLALIFAFLSGALAGFITGILHVKLKITNLLSGILVMIGLYSINLRIMGKPNAQFFNFKTIFSFNISPIILLIILALLFKVILDLFLKTKLGFLLRITGDNETLVTSLGVDKDRVKVLGLMLSNALVAFAGGIMAQYSGFSDVGMGTGIVVTGLAAVILGETFLKRVQGVKETTTALIGAMLYKLSISGALSLGLKPTDLKLVTALIVVLVLSMNNASFKFGLKRKKVIKGGGFLATNKESAQNI
ncbi:ABC transporter permease [Hathewaya histolytica]|uniref:ABC transporter permease n=1 Tax=Hathewaya histolytica TaxID=1498 RepID=A0A4U9R4H3_HATHI|nr:ABC transporter permease [Hathewaya histolytica]VTQ86185.1 ABC transporter permease [Hathewaya histolytica]